MLCKQCSEGKPHAQHDHELEKSHEEFTIAFASTSEEKLMHVLEDWYNKTGNDYYDSVYY
jgi:hypothetical protein